MDTGQTDQIKSQAQFKAVASGKTSDYGQLVSKNGADLLLVGYVASNKSGALTQVSVTWKTIRLPVGKLEWIQADAQSSLATNDGELSLLSDRFASKLRSGLTSVYTITPSVSVQIRGFSSYSEASPIMKAIKSAFPLYQSVKYESGTLIFLIPSKDSNSIAAALVNISSSSKIKLDVTNVDDCVILAKRQLK